jgi:preprotein translocase subunit SecA
VIGTERHESRRIDNQLRGRSGRQGDPGESQFYLSTDDDLMRIFAGDRIRKVMETLKVPDDMPIEQKMITRIIESAQRKVEGMHFDTRKHLLEYDDVLNRHREVIYGKRRAVIEAFAEETAGNLPADGRTLRQMILDMVEQEIEQVVSFHTNTEDKKDWNVQEITETVSTIFTLNEEEKNAIGGFAAQERGQKLEDVEARTGMIEYLVSLSKEKYETALVKTLPDTNMLREIEKQVLLRAMDNLWVDHLVAVDYLRTGIGLRGYAQQDPLVEYKKETFRMFNELLNLIQKEVVYLIYKISVGLQIAPSVMAKENNLNFAGASKTTDGSEVQSIMGGKEKDSDGNVVGRNDQCPCGSGKKYKKCHGA